MRGRAIDGETHAPVRVVRLGGFDQRRVRLGLQVVPGNRWPLHLAGQPLGQGHELRHELAPAPRLTARGRVGGCTTRDRAASRRGSPASAMSRREEGRFGFVFSGKAPAETSHPGSWSALDRSCDTSSCHQSHHRADAVLRPAEAIGKRPPITSSRGSHPVRRPANRTGEGPPGAAAGHLHAQRSGTRTPDLPARRGCPGRSLDLVQMGETNNSEEGS